MSFEQEFRRLEEILGRLEGGDLSLDASLAEYEAGVKALRACRETLAAAEKRIEELTPGELAPSARAGGDAAAE